MLQTLMAVVSLAPALGKLTLSLFVFLKILLFCELLYVEFMLLFSEGNLIIQGRFCKIQF